MSVSLSKQEIADLFAAQTSIISWLSQLLIEAGVLDKQQFTDGLHELLAKQAAEHQGSKPSTRDAPIRHLIRLLEIED